MIRAISIILFLLFLLGCENPSDENIKLRKENRELELKNFSLFRKNRSLVAQNVRLDRSLKEKGIYLEGKEPKYLITLGIKQLDLGKHIKNSLNYFEITLETSREFYIMVNIGDRLNKKVESGSFWVNGDIEHLEIIVKNKKVAL
jgi:hypothetical protein